MQNLLRHSNGRYYAHLFLNGKEIWKSCRVANKSGKERAIKSGKLSLIMKGLERSGVKKDNREGILFRGRFEVEDVAVVEDAAGEA